MKNLTLPLLALSSLLLVGCGQTGKLYHPPEEDTSTQATQSADEPTSDTLDPQTDMSQSPTVTVDE